MIKFNVPGLGEFFLKYAVFDMNGTLTTDGKLSDSTKKRLELLAIKLKIIILTADTFGKAKESFKNLNVELHIISENYGTESKADFIKKLGEDFCVAIGNGNNDTLMLKNAKLGIAVSGEEGLSSKACFNSDIIAKNIDSAIDMILNEKRIIATLRL